MLQRYFAYMINESKQEKHEFHTTYQNDDISGQ